MAGILAALYGTITYAVFLFTLLYAVGFVGGLDLVPKSINSGTPGSLPESLLIDLALLGLFAVQHSVMARPQFKNWWTRLVPRSVERSTYVLFASLALLLLYWQWRPLSLPIWTLDGHAAAIANVTFWFGWGLLLVSTFLISHLELFGLAQVTARLLGRQLPPARFHTPFLYRYVRHPIYLGFLLAFWATPLMTVGHLLFAAATTGYILIAIQLEERDLIRLFGEQYRSYRRQVAMLIPLPRRARTAPRPLPLRQR